MMLTTIIHQSMHSHFSDTGLLRWNDSLYVASTLKIVLPVWEFYNVSEKTNNKIYSFQGVCKADMSRRNAPKEFQHIEPDKTSAK